MAKKRGRVLYADNDNAFLRTRKGFLEAEGYEVLMADSPAEAREILQKRWVHLAIIDLRLTDESQGDISGLTLVKETDPDIPKIIVTAHVSQEATLESLRMRGDGTHPAVDFIGKVQGWEVMIEAVNRLFECRVNINMELAVSWNALDRFSLVHRIEPGLADKYRTDHAVEIEDLFRRLFHRKKHLLVDRVLWQKDGLVALCVYVADEGEAPEGLFAICGPKSAMAEAEERYREWAPRAQGDYGTVLSGVAKTTHFAAHLYALANADLDGAQSFAGYYHGCQERALCGAIDSLFKKTLATWRTHKVRSSVGGQSLEGLYRSRLGLSEDAFPESLFESRVQSLLEQSRAFNWDVRRDGENICLKLADRQLTYPDPVRMLYRLPAMRSPQRLTATPGRFSRDNILVDRDGHAWLTDFSEAGAAPVEWNYVAVEGILRYDWLHSNDIHSVHQMEEQLTLREFARFDADRGELLIRRPLKAIEAVRLQAAELQDIDLDSYKVGLLFQAARRIAETDFELPLRPAAVARLSHTLLSAAMICGQIVNRNSLAGGRTKGKGLQVRKGPSGYSVLKNGIPLRLDPQSLKLLLHLYRQPQHSSTREEIISKVLDAHPDHQPEAKKNRLNTAISRLRADLGDTDKRYIITEYGSCRLVLRPED